MEQQIEHPVITVKKRPTFLLVLCILSFAGIGFVLLSSFITLFSYSSSLATFERYGSEFNNLLGGTDIAQMMALTRIRTIINIIAALVCLAGVLMMWNLKKAGYYIYIVGEIAPFIISTILFWNSYNNPFLSFVFWISTILSLIFALAFTIMYGVNLKHMS